MKVSLSPAKPPAKPPAKICHNPPNPSPSDGIAILEAAKNGDIHAAYRLYKEGSYPKDAVLIGVSVELAEYGSIGPGAKEYFRKLATTHSASQNGHLVIPIPLNATFKDKELSCLETLSLPQIVARDLEGLDGVVVPGDEFNFPALRADLNPRQAILEYSGRMEYHDHPTIYGESAKDFYLKHGDHALNPHPESLIYEAELLSQLKKTDQIVMTSCHGTQMYAVLAGAHLLADIEGHNTWKPGRITIDPDSMAYEYQGPLDETSWHIHKLAIDPKGLPSHLKVVGTSDGVVEIIEEKEGKPYYGYQTHPEFVPHHPSLEAFVSSVIERHSLRK